MALAITLCNAIPLTNPLLQMCWSKQALVTPSLRIQFQCCAPPGLQGVAQEHKVTARSLLQVDTAAQIPPFPGAFSARPVADASVYIAVASARAAAVSAATTGGS